MKLSTRGRYGVRAMCELASYYGKEVVSLKTISRKQKIAAPYLERLLAKLKKAGLLETVRGCKGGYRLSRSPHDIKIAEIFTALEGPIGIIDCVVYGNCDNISQCPSYPIWKTISDGIARYLGSITVEDACRREAGNFELIVGPSNLRTGEKTSLAGKSDKEQLEAGQATIC